MYLPSQHSQHETLLIQPGRAAVTFSVDPYWKRDGAEDRVGVARASTQALNQPRRTPHVSQAGLASPTSVVMWMFISGRKWLPPCWFNIWRKTWNQRRGKGGGGRPRCLLNVQVCVSVKASVYLSYLTDSAFTSGWVLLWLAQRLWPLTSPRRRGKSIPPSTANEHRAS